MPKAQAEIPPPIKNGTKWGIIRNHKRSGSITNHTSSGKMNCSIAPKILPSIKRSAESGSVLLKVSKRWKAVSLFVMLFISLTVN